MRRGDKSELKDIVDGALKDKWFERNNIISKKSFGFKGITS
jgi:hypothetical protein